MTLAEIEERLRKILKVRMGSYSHALGEQSFEFAPDAKSRLIELLMDLERARLGGGGQ